MRVMLVGTDRTLFTPGSAVYRRFEALGAQFPDDEFIAIVFSLRRHKVGPSCTIRENVRAYATGSRSRFLYILDALRVAKRSPRPDVVSAVDPFETGLVGFFIAQHFAAPLVLEAHTDFTAAAFVRHSLLNRLRLLIARFSISRVAGLYAVSERVRAGIIRRYHPHVLIEVLPIFAPSVSSGRVQAAPHTGISLLWVGRLESEKRPELALKALKAAHDAGILDTRLTFVGGGRLRDTLVSCASALGIGDCVEFAGVQADVQTYYAQADLLLVTSAYEGYGLVIVEALAAGVPVLSTDVGIAREAGALVAKGNYPHALLDWLAGPRIAGVLKLHPYQDEREYLARVRAFYQSIARV